MVSVVEDVLELVFVYIVDDYNLESVSNIY